MEISQSVQVRVNTRFLYPFIQFTNLFGLQMRLHCMTGRYAYGASKLRRGMASPAGVLLIHRLTIFLGYGLRMSS